jgi:hypothetical protein
MKHSRLQWFSWRNSLEFADSRLWIDRHAGVEEPGRGGAGLRPCDLCCRERAGKRILEAHSRLSDPRVAGQHRRQQSHHVLWFDLRGCLGISFELRSCRDVVQNNRFEGNCIAVVQGSATPAGSNPTKPFRFGSEYLELEQAQQRGQETHSNLEIDPSGTSANLAVKCPRAVVGRGAPR